jgi:threonine-phosphate decarboxylase
MASPCKQRRFVSHGGDVWGFSRKHNVPVEKVLDFSAPINFLGASPKAVEAVREHAGLIRFYPDPNPLELKTEVAKYVGHGVGVENVILGNGSIELIYMLTEVFPAGFKAVIPVPSFTEYEKAALRVHGEVIYVKLREDFALDVESIKKAVTGDTRIIYICNPHSPSGKLYGRDTVLELVEFCQNRNITVSVDENYIEFTNKTDETTLAGHVKKYENLFVIRSVTKFYGMPGVRFGYGLAAESVIDTLETVRQPWSINSLAGVATLAAFKDSEFIENTRRFVATERSHFAKMMNDVVGLRVFPSETNFLLVKIQKKKLTSTKLKEEMAEKGILIRDCSTFVGLDDTYFRVTVRSTKDNVMLVDTLKEIVAKDKYKD